MQVVNHKNEEVQSITAKEEMRTSPPPYKPKVSYPQRNYLAKVREQFNKLLSEFEKLDTNAHLVDEVKKSSTYVNFLKEVVSRKLKLEDMENSLKEGKVFPPKLDDPRSFTIS